MNFEIHDAAEQDAEAISALIGELKYLFLDASSDEASRSFLQSLTPDAVRQRIACNDYLHLVAESGGQIVGVIVMRNRSHLYHLFVSAPYHRHGIAKSLWARAQRDPGTSTYTVNSSLFAVPVYERLGFTASGSLQSKDGVTFQPMLFAARS